MDRNSRIAHEQLIEKARKGGIDIYFLGDSITRRWGANDYPEFLANWNTNFFGWNAADFGWGADKIEHILWRLENGELDGVNPKVIVILAGTNDIAGNTGPSTLEMIEDNLASMTELAQANGIKVVLSSVLPVFDYPWKPGLEPAPKIVALNAWIKA